jgi:uncharacterized SAM-binding protein YcdF (DUF218 family)
MFFILSKIFAFLITPIIWIFILLCLAVFLKNRTLAKKSGIAALVVLYLFSNSFLLDECIRLWEFPASPKALEENFDAGIVMGGMLSYDKKNDKVQFQRQVDRLLQAVVLYRKGNIKKIMYTSGSGSLMQDIPEAKYAKRFLLEIGIPEKDIMIEFQSKNTHENAVFTKQILDKELPQGRFLLITSGMHMTRAKACFEKLGLSVIPYSTDRYSGPRKFIFDHVFIPEAGTLFLWNNFLHEILGYVSYKVIGYV